MGKIPIGLQLYSVREDCAKDLPGVIAAVAKMGYVGVEFAGYHGFSAKELNQMLADNGLNCCGTHIGLDTLLGDALPASIDFHQELGNQYLIVPGLAENRRNSRVAWQETARLMNEIADELSPHGLRTGYHNHNIEFQPLDGELPWDTFFGNTKPEVIMQFDVGNALHGNGKGDASSYLKKYPGRAATVHVKEYSATNDQALIGEGDVNWSEIFGLCESIGGTEWYIVEQESYAYPPLECVDRCLQNLRDMGK